MSSPAHGESGSPRRTVTVVLRGRTKTVTNHNGETVLQSVRRAGMAPPFHCEAGHCATCVAQLIDGKVALVHNEALSDDELASGLILTCQAVPESWTATIEYH
ncbi:2Fe-2S iron-sulfur cluster-binding protein [Gordonia sp. NPDC127522]|uniref:2Fe-2S iron-sulfur cluster-binding protein n=1 Tax=Gordonia sp. NPDC127522 TaxID=3345390 RepID=UPI00363AB6FB